jgi:hypothetical protein
VSAQLQLFTLAAAESSEISWEAFLDVMHSGDTYEVDVAMYDRWLDVLPPDGMLVRKTVGSVTRTYDFIFREGEGPRIGFWHEGDRYFLQRLAEE